MDPPIFGIRITSGLPCPNLPYLFYSTLLYKVIAKRKPYIAQLDELDWKSKEIQVQVIIAQSDNSLSNKVN